MEWSIVKTLKKALLEEQKSDHTNRNGSVRDIENGTKEFKFLAPHKRQPMRKSGPDDRKIKHVYHTTMQKTTIPMSRKAGDTTVTDKILKRRIIVHTLV